MDKIPQPPLTNDLNATSWFKQLAERYPEADINFIKNIYELCYPANENTHTLAQQSLAIASILDKLHLDKQTIAAGLVLPAFNQKHPHSQILEEQLGLEISKLLASVKKMDDIPLFHAQSLQRAQPAAQIDNIRKMLLAMAQDVRVVLIKLAERTVKIRNAQLLTPAQQQSIAKEIQDIYAPLANRLGIAQIKWELEDLAFRVLQPEIYKKIRLELAMKRSERENFIAQISVILEEALFKIELKNFQISGRAKHIYSIHQKMQRKQKDFQQIFDVSALRILVVSLEDCYAALGVVHSLWEPISSEFDDYIAHPKPNGYRSLHTAVKAPGKHNLEIQIRTYKMHEESELGVAAHWVYKENSRKQSSYDQKISWLRRLLEWQHEVIQTPQIFEDRIYVFTPEGDIIDLPQNATPLDFAYQIHTQLGHRCRGAKVNNKIVSLTSSLKTGDRIEILTSKYPNPSLDWLSPHSGYLHTARARGKVQNWFKKLDYDKNHAAGQEMLQRELKRLHIKQVNIAKLIEKYQQKSYDDLLAAIGSGDIRMGQILHTLESLHPQPKTTSIKDDSKIITDKTPSTEGILILGMHDLLTRIANCCQPSANDPIIGYITRGRGVSIHRQDCPNIRAASERQQKRLIAVSWSKKNV